MTQIKAGARLRSAVCSAEVMVIAAPEGAADVRCGGAPLIDLGAEPPTGAKLDPNLKDGSALGKRYVNESGDLELLCTKPGEGTLSLGDTRLALKEAKPLPSSD